MSTEKRYYWLKLKDDFFSSMRIKKMRRLAGGDTLTIIYLKLQLKAMKSDGSLEWTGLEANIFDELALDLDEEPGNVEMCLRYLLSCGLAEADEATQKIFLPWAIANTGSESSSAERVRRFRENQKALPCNADVTPQLRTCNTEKEKDIEKDTEIEKEVKAPAHKFGQYGWVKLTDVQYQKLLKDLGQAELDRCIQYVDESAQSNHNKNHWTDWNLIIRRCARGGWGQDSKPNSKPKQYTTTANYKAPSGTIDELKAVVDSL